MRDRRAVESSNPAETEEACNTVDRFRMLVIIHRG